MNYKARIFIEGVFALLFMVMGSVGAVAGLLELMAGDLPQGVSWFVAGLLCWLLMIHQIHEMERWESEELRAELERAAHSPEVQYLMGDDNEVRCPSCGVYGCDVESCVDGISDGL